MTGAHQHDPDEAERLHAPLLQRLRAHGMPPDLHAPDADIPGFTEILPIARGGQGVVYSGIQASTGRRVAIKVIADDPGEAPGRAHRFEREIEIIAQLRHPNIVSIIDSGVAPSGRRYLVMDLIEGTTLDEFADEPGTTTQQLLRSFCQVCSAVHHAHQNTVLHRDIKPSNILIDDEGAPHLLDFGLARREASNKHQSITFAGAVAGTLAYMAPEQARGSSRLVDVRSDVFSLGAVLFRCVAGKPPRACEGDLVDVLARIADEPVPAPNAISPGCAGDELQTIIQRATALDPQRRYQSAGELGEDIARLLAGEPIDAKRDSSMYVLRKSLVRHRLPVALGSLFLITICASAIAMGVLYAGQLRATRAANERFDQVRHLAGTLISEIDPLIMHLPGSAQTRMQLVQRSIEYLDTVAAGAAGETQLQLEIAGGYTTIGDILGDRTQSNLGRPAEAIDLYERAQDMYLDVLSREPAHLGALNGMHISLSKIAEIRSAAGSYDDSRAAFTDALRYARLAIDAGPDDITARRGEYSVLERLARFYRSDGDQEAAHEAMTRANALAQALADEYPDDLKVARDVVVSYADIAEHHAALGEYEQARENFALFLAGAQELERAQPDSIVAIRDVATGHEWMGRLGAHLEDHEQAIESLLACEASVQSASASALEREHELLIQANQCSVRLGELFIELGRLEEAKATYDRTLARSLRIVELAPDLGAGHRLLGVSYYKLSEYHRAIGADDSLDAAHRAEHWNQAAVALERCRETFIRMRDRDLLDPSDAGVPDAMTAEIQTCMQEHERLLSGG